MHWETIWPIIAAIFASTGFWQLISNIYNTRSKKKSTELQLLIGLAHNAIFEKCERYIERGYITSLEYDDLLYIYTPYKEKGGNGTGARLMERVEKLPIQETTA